MHRLLPAAFLLSSPLPQSTLPPGFVDELIAGGFDIPTGIAIDPAGRLFVAEKRGRVWIVDDGAVLPAPFIDLEDEVGNANDRGLMGIALDPEFDQNGFVYLPYVVDPIYGPPDEPGFPDPAVTFSRLTRYRARGDTAVLASRRILIGTSSADGFVQCSGTHAIGAVRFAADGTLFVSAGDGARPEFVDSGTSEEERECGETFPGQGVGALRAQVLHSLNGKVLRIDPSTGLGLSDNPFFDGDPASFQSRVWARGFRQPFRFAVRPGTGPFGTLYVADVGWDHWEELNVVQAPGQNFGWPCYEGELPQPDYQGDPVAGAYCDGLAPGDVSAPLLSWSHGPDGSSSTGLAFYDGTGFPPEYWGACFFTDYAGDWIHVARVDAADQLLSVEPFAQTDGPIDVLVEPATGDLLYIAVIQGEIRRIRYVEDGSTPFARASADPAGGVAPLEVRFSSDGSYDPDGDAIRLEWSFGDGSPPTTAANPVHTYAIPDTHPASLRVTDATGRSSTATVPVQAGNEPPRVQIAFPPPLYPFIAGEFVEVERTASDPEDGAALVWDWVVQLIHNDHIHEVLTSDAPVPPPIRLDSHGSSGDRYSYRILVTVTDSAGLDASDSVVVLPYDTGPNTAPVAALVATPTVGLPPLAVSFDASPSSDAELDLLSHAWDFGDGLRSNAAVTTHVFDAPGTYTVTLTVTDILGESDIESVLVRVDPSDAVARYSFAEGSGSIVRDVSSVGPPLDLAIHDPRAVTWLPGGGLSVDSPTRLATSGPATKLLDAIQASQALTVEAWVEPADATQFGPARIVAVSEDSVPHGADLVLGQSADEYEMRVRTQETDQYGLPGYSTPPGSATTDLTHVVYTRSDAWTGRLYLDGALSTTGFGGGDLSPWGSYGLTLANEPTGDRPWRGALHQVALYARALDAAEVAEQFAKGPRFSPLDAEFSATPTTGEPRLFVGFTDLSRGDTSSWSWDFGDAGTSTLRNPTHTYNSAGDYTVRLTVTGLYGVDTDTKVGFVRVSEPAPVAQFAGQPRSGQAPLSVDFIDLSSGDVSSWTWSFGDGEVSFERNPSHTYATPGLYPVRLTVNGAGGPDSEIELDYVSVTPSDCPATSYCVTSPNSVGPGATIAASGSTSIAADDFRLVASGLPPVQFGIFYYGLLQAQIPFGNGFRCIQGLVYRLRPPALADGTGQASHRVDFDDPPLASGRISAGSTWNFQFWYRDPAGGGAFFNLTDGLTATFCP